MAQTPGLLYVTMHPHADLPPSHFHDWYNNEHGPTRLRLPFITNGLRYRATDISTSSSSATPSTITAAADDAWNYDENDTHGPSPEHPEWLALYDVSDMSQLHSDAYLRLRAPPAKSPREVNVMQRIDVDRQLYDLVGSSSAPGFRPVEAKDMEPDADEEEKGRVLVTVRLRVRPGRSTRELDAWYGEEHAALLARVPGWRRSRWYRTSRFSSSSDGSGGGGSNDQEERKEEEEPTDYLALHEYAPTNGIGGEAFEAAHRTPRAASITSATVAETRRRVYALHYVFGPAPRHLSARGAPFAHAASGTRTVPAVAAAAEEERARAAIESYARTDDGVRLPYRLEGGADPRAPAVVLCNAVLVDWGIWDGFVDAFLADGRNRGWRVVRYLARGRAAACGEGPVTVERLARDVVALLDALRIPVAAAVVGVSLGGATALDVALRYPRRLAAFVACDTNASSPPGNEKVWRERIAIAEAEGAMRVDENGNREQIVGEELAELSVRRWAAPGSYDGGRVERSLERVKSSVIGNSLDGFKSVVRALWDYDLWPGMKACPVEGVFLAGGDDGKLPTSMKEMAAGYGRGADMIVIDGAGHLPMVEKPYEVARRVTDLLAAR